ncbi:MAG: hypothetical protein DRH90_22755 [Deltaproteobacteria bacterium]|nr:MAG: hypothetical protein DRH90_22755 [Deltaproteobacteria bacterium]RLC08446.1 MAG: hypothetical protein DRI24_23335 [Deltaproteobacteria bacterium]
MKERKTPVTRKSRTVESLASALVDIVRGGDAAPKKAEIVARYIFDVLGSDTDRVAVDILSSEMSNMLDCYFSEVCRAAADVLQLEYHYTSKAWFAARKRLPQDEQDAKRFVVVFGNGRTGKAQGVRFVSPDDEPDPMLLVALEKSCHTVTTAFQTHTARIQKTLASGVVGVADAARLSGDTQHRLT